MTSEITIVWSQAALDDLTNIRDYIALTSPRYAAIVAERLLESVERLAAFPESGRVVPELGEPTVREVIHGAYRLMYEVRAPDRVEILTVFRATRSLPRND